MTVLLAAAAPAAENARQIEQRLLDTVRHLSADELQGRGVGTQGLDQAADFVADQFAGIGLKTNVFGPGPFQPFTVTTDARMGPADQNTLQLVPPSADGKAPPAAPAALALGKDFNPLAAGGSARFDLPLVFAGYGITSEEAKYDDYDGIDANGKCVIVLRHQPQRGSPHSPFGADPSPDAYFETKISNAVAHGAAGILFCTGSYEIESQLDQLDKRWQAAVDELSEANTEFKKDQAPPPDAVDQHRKKVTRLAQQIQRMQERIESQQDPVLDIYRAGSGSASRQIPIVHCRRGVIDGMVKTALGKDLAAIEGEIDREGRPRSAELPNWHAVGQTNIQRQQADIKNVVGIWEGEGPLAEETIIVGAHYDHLGYGGESSAEPGSKEVHNGADDNASGVAVLLEVARRVVSLNKRLPRRIVFIAFTGEERGLLGSAYYVKSPVVPLDQTVAMLNLDMVGRLKDNKLIVNGTGSAAEFDVLVKRLNAQHNFDLARKASGFGPSDHATFYEKKIPVLHFFTGAHQDYHRPSDDSDKINAEGMRRVASLVTDVAVAVAESDQRPAYRKTKRTAMAGGKWPYFGSRPDYGYEQPGVRLEGVAPDSPAERGGAKPGDVMIRFGKAKVATVADFAQVLSRHKAGDKVEIVVQREGNEVTLTVTLDPPKR